MERAWMKHVVDGNPKEIDIPQISLTQLLNDSITRFSEHEAMTFKQQIYTYDELNQWIKNAARALSKLGLQKEDRVALMLPNCPAYPICFYAALTCGATIVQVNPMYKASELIHILNDSGAKLLITFDQLLPLVNSVIERTSVEEVISVSHESGMMPEKLNDQTDDPLPSVNINPQEDVAVLQYTGGTTGVPKGAMLTHYNIVANILQSVATTLFQTKQGEERVLAISPLFHVYGMTSAMCTTFYNGGNLILVPRFEVEEVVKLIEQTKPTAFPGVPTMFIALTEYYKKRKFNLSGLEQCTSGSAPLPVEVLNKFNEISGTSVAEGYGLSESSPVTHRNPVGGLQKPGSIGIPIPNTDAKIVDIATGKNKLPIGEVGELIIKGPQVMKGYWNNPEETALTLRDGWLFTGDLAKMDKDGFFYIVGRKKEMILAGGYNVYPIEVENVLYNHPAVLEAAAIGVPDKYRGETICAVITLKKGKNVTESELIDFCRSQLSAYKVPTEIIFVDEIPKTVVGKILKRSLKVHFVNSKNLNSEK